MAIEENSAQLKSEFLITTVPTSIATCCASSEVSIMYDDGVLEGFVAMNKEVDVVIADRSLIKEAPKRLLAAGMVDSLAKLPEVVHNMDIRTYLDNDIPKYICKVNSDAI